MFDFGIAEVAPAPFAPLATHVVFRCGCFIVYMEGERYGTARMCMVHIVPLMLLAEARAMGVLGSS